MEQKLLEAEEALLRLRKLVTMDTDKSGYITLIPNKPAEFDSRKAMQDLKLLIAIIINLNKDVIVEKFYNQN